MVGTVVDYSEIDSSSHYIKILSGEKLFTIYLDTFPKDVKMNIQVEFDSKNNTYSILK